MIWCAIFYAGWTQHDAPASRMIRRAVLSDVEAVRTCARDAYGRYVERMGKEPAPMIADFEGIIARGDLYVFDDAGKVTGFIVFYPSATVMHLENVAVNPCARGLGHGARLIDFAENQARAEGFVTIELYTNEKMTENFCYYKARGYVETGRRTESGFNRVFFEKQLT